MDAIFLDTETNGLNFNKHRLVELAFKIVDLLTGQVKREFHSLIALSQEQWALSDRASLKINGFTWEETSHGITPAHAHDQVIDLFKREGIQRGSSVFICQNPSFDRYFFSQLIDADEQEKLNWPYHWLDLASMYWAKAMQSHPPVYPWQTGFSKDKIATVYKLPSEGYPHRAMNGVDHLILCYEAVVGFPHK